MRKKTEEEIEVFTRVISSKSESGIPAENHKAVSELEGQGFKILSFSSIPSQLHFSREYKAVVVYMKDLRKEEEAKENTEDA